MNYKGISFYFNFLAKAIFYKKEKHVAFNKIMYLYLIMENNIK